MKSDIFYKLTQSEKLDTIRKRNIIERLEAEVNMDPPTLVLIKLDANDSYQFFQVSEELMKKGDVTIQDGLYYYKGFQLSLTLVLGV